MQTARMTIDLPLEFKNLIKSQSASLGKNLKDYVMEALETKLKLDEEQEDEYLAKLSKKAKKEGFISKKASVVLLRVLPFR